MAAIDRLSALCDQTALTGIDFIQVVEPTVQTRLRVFFVVEPTALAAPMIAAGDLTPPGPGAVAGPQEPAVGLVVTIVSDEGGAEVEITGLDWRVVVAPAGNRVALEVTVRAPGDFSIHRLTIEDARVDPFFNDVAFSFKQGCPSVFDCRSDCPPEPIESRDHPIDYLARDFWSLRRALLDFAAERQPQWSEALEADQAVMLLEIMAALGDEFAYTQDRISRETALESATQRRSRSSLARLVDYFPDPGMAAVTELAVWVAAGGGGDEPAPEATVWALPEGRPPVPFSVLDPVWHHEAWNEIPFHCPDSDVACLPAGATEAFLLTDAPTAAQLPPGTVTSPAEFWTGRRAVFRSRPADPAEPARAVAVTITGVEPMTDQLAPTPGVPTDIARITWDEPTPWPLPLAETTALLNIVPVMAGRREVELFRVGSDEAVADRLPGLGATDLEAVLALPRAVEREGPYDVERGGRTRVLRYGLRTSESAGLGWRRPTDAVGLDGERARMPLLTLTEVLPPLNVPDAGAPRWQFFRDILGADLDSAAFTMEEGMWREVVTHQTPFTDVVFDDYSGDQGWTLRFGDGAFGRPPADGTVMQVAFFTAPGTAANLPPDSVVHLTPPPSAGPGPLFGYARAVTNPLTITSGVDEESPESVRINAPERFRARPRRAVRPDDYSAILERLTWVQRAHATTRWTGSWSTYFIAADPAGGFAPTAEQREDLDREIEAIRQATRDARPVDPEYLDIDLEVDICASRDSYPGDVAERVTRELAVPGFFAPDNFTFGQPLHRSRLEHAIQCVPGVRGVEEIRLRVRRRRDWTVFTASQLPVEPWQIVRLQNDPGLPGRGSLRVLAHGGAA